MDNPNFKDHALCASVNIVSTWQMAPLCGNSENHGTMSIEASELQEAKS